MQLPAVVYKKYLRVRGNSEWNVVDNSANVGETPSSNKGRTLLNVTMKVETPLL